MRRAQRPRPKRKMPQNKRVPKKFGGTRPSSRFRIEFGRGFAYVRAGKEDVANLSIYPANKIVPRELAESMGYSHFSSQQRAFILSFETEHLPTIRATIQHLATPGVRAFLLKNGFVGVIGFTFNPTISKMVSQVVGGGVVGKIPTKLEQKKFPSDSFLSFLLRNLLLKKRNLLPPSTDPTLVYISFKATGLSTFASVLKKSGLPKNEIVELLIALGKSHSMSINQLATEIPALREEISRYNRAKK